MTVKRYSAMHKDVWTDESGKYVRYEEYAALKSKMDMINDLMSAAEQANALAKEGVEALRKERDALAAENAGLRRFISGSCYVFDGDHDDDMPDEFIDASHYMPIVTPATDAAIANIQAQGVDKLATFAGKEYQRFVGDKTLQRKWKGIALLCTDFASQLRNEATHD